VEREFVDGEKHKDCSWCKDDEKPIDVPFDKFVEKERDNCRQYS